jgi:DNA-binding MarR family transcriptional regulator
MDKPQSPPVDSALAIVLAGRLLSERILRELHRGGWADLREADGYVFQHLLAGPVAVTALAERIGVTQQAVSKSVADLEARGYVTRTAAEDDARVRLVSLTNRGLKAVARTRVLRARLAKEIEAVAAREGDATFAAALAAVLEHLGGAAVLRDRSLTPPT